MNLNIASGIASLSNQNEAFFLKKLENTFKSIDQKIYYLAIAVIGACFVLYFLLNRFSPSLDAPLPQQPNASITAASQNMLIPKTEEKVNADWIVERPCTLHTSQVPAAYIFKDELDEDVEHFDSENSPQPVEDSKRSIAIEAPPSHLFSADDLELSDLFASPGHQSIANETDESRQISPDESSIFSLGKNFDILDLNDDTVDSDDEDASFQDFGEVDWPWDEDVLESMLKESSDESPSRN